MKLAACYTVYDGLELLEGAMQSVAACVDEFVIVFQDVSNHGEKDDTVLKRVEKIADKFYNVTIVHYKTDLSLTDKTNELKKHNEGLRVAKSLGCSHFFFAATDHYYKRAEVMYAKEVAKDFDLTLTSMFTYFKKPTWQLTPKEDYFMPFICRLYPETLFVEGVWKLPYLVDPSVRINTNKKHYLFKDEEIMLHHYSVVRDNVEKKYRNAAGSKRWGARIEEFLKEYNEYDIKVNPGVNYFHGRKIIKVPNYFNI